MGSLIKKKIKGNTYYYYVESKRINGKPKHVNQKCLGTLDKLLERAVREESPLQDRVLYSHIEDFGAVTMLYDIAMRIGVADIIDKHLPKRKQGASVGMYVLTEAINRAVAPVSTANLEEWYAATCLPQLTGIPGKAFTAQNFWNNTDISEDTLRDIEDDILKAVCSKYDINLTDIIYDATNFFTYIDTMRDCASAKRGHSKEKRNDLRIVGMSLMVSPDFSIPLLHDTYPGNRSDAEEFAVMMNSLRARYEAITGKKGDVTVVFDRGNNSSDNLSLFEDEDFPFHYVGGLKRNQSEALFHVPKADYVALDPQEFPEHMAYRTEYAAFGRKVTALVVYNPALHKGQLQGIRINVDKTTGKLLDLQQKLLLRSNGGTRKGKKPTIESVTASVEKILRTEYMDKVFTYSVIEQDSNPLLVFAFSYEALKALSERELGKTVLFTDRDDFTNEQIVKAYRSAWHVESSFKQMKDTDHLTMRPIFHWTDKRIKVHVFTCVLAYRLCCLLRKELSSQGIDISIDKMIEEAGKLKRVTTFFDNPNKPQRVVSFTEGSDITSAISSFYRLQEKYS